MTAGRSTPRWFNAAPGQAWARATLVLFMVLLATAVLSPARVSAAGPGDGAGAITGSVSLPGPRPAAGVTVDLFTALTSSWNRGSYLRSTTSGDDGRFRFDVDDGCYVVVLVAPAAASFSAGSPYWQQPVCVERGRPQRSLDAELRSPPAATGRLQGRVTFRDARGVGGVVIDVFAADGTGGRGLHLRTTSTASDGRFGFDVRPGCYTLVLTAPAGDTFADGGPFLTEWACVAPGGTGGPDVALASTADRPPALSAVEEEIVRLTNALRSDPDGPLARRKPMPTCIGEAFYALSLDPATGHPQPAAPLQVDLTVAASVSRAWAREMARSGTFEHRTSAAQQLLYDQLDRRVAVWGENIAWFAGYDPARTARIHFEGWRESDTGHYCSMLTSRFTHLGVGELFRDGESWAVQNFYG